MSHSISEGNQARTSKQGPEAGTKGEGMGRGGGAAPRALLSLISSSIQDHQSRGGTAHSDLCPLTPIIKEENIQ